MTLQGPRAAPAGEHLEARACGCKSHEVPAQLLELVDTYLRIQAQRLGVLPLQAFIRSTPLLSYPEVDADVCL